MNQQSKTTGAVIYTRVSTGEQDKHGTSPETQLAACRARALSLGLPIAAEYHDGGVSGGFLLTREGMQKAIADIREGRADTLICANLSRFSRDVSHQREIKKAVRATGGRLIFCDMTFEDTPEGDLNFTIQGGFAEYEKAIIRKRTMAGRQARAEAGIQTARLHSPMGYHIVNTKDVLSGTHPADMQGKYLVVEEEAAIVRDLFGRYAAGESLPSLAKRMNESGIPTRSNGAFWRANSLRYILSNPVYKRLAAFGKNDYAQDESRVGKPHPRTDKPMKTCRVVKAADFSTWITWSVPAIVSEEIWDSAQARFARNASRLGGNPSRVRMLAGRITCPECGGSMIAQRTQQRNGEVSFRYVCGRDLETQKNIGTHICLTTRYPVDTVEAAVVEAITAALRRSAAIKEVIRAAIAAYNEPTPGESGKSVDSLAEIDTEIAKLARRQAAAVEAQIAGIMAGAEPAAYAEVFSKIAEQRKRLEERRDALTRAVKPAKREAVALATSADFPRLLADVRRVLSSPAVPGAEKRTAVGTLVESVRPIDGGAQIDFLPGVFSHSEDTFQFSQSTCPGFNPAAFSASVIISNAL